MTASLQAQDTISSDTLNGNYFCNHFVESDTVLSIQALWLAGAYDEEAVAYHTSDSLQIYGLAIGITFQDLARLYADTNRHRWVETTIDSTYCRVRLYVPNGNTMDVVGEGRVYMRDPISYFFALNKIDGANPDSTVSPIPVYEVFFDHPVTVIDTFYVGYNYSCSDSWNSVTGVTTYSARYIYLTEGYAEIGTQKSPRTHAFHDVDEDPAPWKIMTSLYSFDHNFLYAITTPADTTPAPIDTLTSGYIVLRPSNTLVITPGDTLIVAGDTLVNLGDTLVVATGDTLVLPTGEVLILAIGDTLVVNPGDTLFVNPDGSIVLSSGGTVVILSSSGSSSGGGDDPGVGVQQADLVYRYTAVAPNPATGKVKVTSSFGISSLEAYDLKGRKVHEFRAEGCEHLETSRYCSESIPNSEFSINLDVSSWPRGTYLLRILTPLGPTTKKLLLQ